MVELLILLKAIVIFVYFYVGSYSPVITSRIPLKIKGRPTTFKIGLRIKPFTMISTPLIEQDNMKLVKLHIDPT